MKIRYLKFKSWLLTLAAAALGISCTESAVEYGTPEATYHVKGTVSDPDGKPIPGIEVNHYGHPYDTTDPQGAYAFTLKSAFPSLPIDNVTFADIDSTENGSYQDTTVSIPTADVPLSGGNRHWYEGQGDINYDITLNPKNNDK